MRATLALLVVMLGAAALMFAARSPRAVPAEQRPPLGLFTSLPLLWTEAPDPSAMLRQGEQSHWAGVALATNYRVVPFNILEQSRLSRVRVLLIAQPRPLAPVENVALDEWVLAGGHVLLFADPMLTWESQFPLGDPRRPQDVVLLSPILAHWGLRLTFDEDQPVGVRESAGSGLPINLAGRLEPLSISPSPCRIEAGGLMAECRIGAGKALIVADAALFEPAEQADSRAQALLHLIDRVAHN